MRSFFSLGTSLNANTPICLMPAPRWMAVSAGSASERAAAQDVKGGKQLMRSSYMLRMGAIAVILFVLVKAGVCNVITAILPLLFVRWILTVAEVFRKKGRS